MRNQLKDITGLEFRVGDTVVTGTRQGSGSGRLVVRKVVEIKDGQAIVCGTAKTCRKGPLVVEALIINDMDKTRIVKAQDHG